jgi:hypothetical protein
MRGHIIAEEQFLHQGIDHRIFVTAIENTENEYRFEVRRIAPGGDRPETIYEKVVDLSSELTRCPDTTIDQLINAELDAVKYEVSTEEDIRAHDP